MEEYETHETRIGGGMVTMGRTTRRKDFKQERKKE